jgi:DNA-directed RNA polymerase II subunit RPB1
MEFQYDNEIKRKLTQDEIEFIIKDIIPDEHRFGTLCDAEKNAIENNQDNIRRQLQSIELYPHLIGELKKTILTFYNRSRIAPGEMVGCVAASSIGEQFTQQSLNSFHSSGLHKANLTGGLKRIQELLNITKNPHTPSLTIFFNPKTVDVTSLKEVRKIAHRELVWTYIKQIVKSYKVEFQPRELGSFYSVHSKLMESTWTETNPEGESKFQYRIRFYIDHQQLWKIGKTLRDITHFIQGNLRYEFAFVYSCDWEGILDVWINHSNLPKVSSILSKVKQCKDRQKQRVLQFVPDSDAGLWFCKKIILHDILWIPISGVKQLQECYYNQKVIPGTELKEWYIETKAGELGDLINKTFVDSKRCTSNNIWDIYHLFGVTATREFLKTEFEKQIKINPRHLDLLINGMTNTGKLKSVSRHGIDRREVGPLAKASFEQPVDNYIISATQGERDPISSVSAAVTVGKLANIGTNVFELITDKSSVTNFRKNKKQKLPTPGTSQDTFNFNGEDFDDDINDDLDEEEEEEQTEINEYLEDIVEEDDPDNINIDLDNLENENPYEDDDDQYDVDSANEDSFDDDYDDDQGEE